MLKTVRKWILQIKDYTFDVAVLDMTITTCVKCHMCVCETMTQCYDMDSPGQSNY